MAGPRPAMTVGATHKSSSMSFGIRRDFARTGCEGVTGRWWGRSASLLGTEVFGDEEQAGDDQQYDDGSRGQCRTDLKRNVIPHLPRQRGLQPAADEQRNRQFLEGV